MEINPDTGKSIGSVSHIYGGGYQSIEAPYITRDGNYYYLYVNRGTCCDGLNSSYYVQVGRSTSITGPYTGWRTLLPNSDGRYRGPGHIGLLQEGSCSYVSVHYYDAADNGNAKLDILRLNYSGGWPQLTRNFTPGNCTVTGSAVPNGTYVIEARHSGRAISSVGHAYTNGAMTEQRTYGGSPAQRWNVTNLGNGYYSIVNMASGRSLDVWELSPDLGASIAQWEYWAGDGQQWALESVGNGYFRIRSRLSGHVLDIESISSANGASIIQWSVTGNTNQHFRFVAP